jgi:hypothetical protein
MGSQVGRLQELGLPEGWECLDEREAGGLIFGRMQKPDG